MAKKENYNDLSRERLTQLEQEQRIKIVQLREQMVGKKVKNTSQIGREKRELARILTAQAKIQ
ncbi:MAG TPA: 50S ribosomal protein L29 [Candidatus Paceibacterota bacterium]|nr:50S ribosomal protein L29 [Candidatus Paceibacterota bacterium]